MSEGRWAPLLEGDLAASARASVRAIGDTLASAGVAPQDAADVALYWAYAAGELDDPQTDDRYSTAVDRLVDRISGEHDLHQLFGGLAGDAWVLAHIATESAAEVLGLVDRELLELLSVERWTRPYDLVGGLAGYGVYFLERLHNATEDPAAAKQGLARVIHHLHSLHVHAPGGVTWKTAHEHVPGPRAADAPDGYYDLGVAHGIAGVIALLGKVIALGDPPPRTEHMLDDAMQWLWTHRQPPAPEGRFPAFLIPGRMVRRTRTAWCYGDPGIAVATWLAAIHRGGSTADSLALARDVASRLPEHTQIVEAQLCHGAVGLAHLLARCHHASGDPALRESAIEWYRRALALPVPPRADLLEGAPGIGLALLAGLSTTEPAWDRRLLCDLPVRT